MAKRNSIPKRISPELDDILKEIKEKNEMTYSQASKELAKIFREMKIAKTKIRREIKF